MSQGQLSPYLYSQALLGGNLNFGSSPGGMFSGNLQQLDTSYQSAYQNALNLNQQNYANVLSGYQNLQGQQARSATGIQQGYQRLTEDVLGGIGDITGSQRQAIRDAYAQQSGTQAQQLINRGLGNTTVQQSTQRGLSLDEQKAQVALANQMAQLFSGYRSSLGLASLNYANQANAQNAALGAQQLGFMGSVQANYPSAQAYASTAAGIRAQQEAQKNRALIRPLGGGVGGASGVDFGGGAPRLPRGVPGASSGYQGGGGYGIGGGGGGGGSNPYAFMPPGGWEPTPDFNFPEPANWAGGDEAGGYQPEMTWGQIGYPGGGGGWSAPWSLE